MTAIRDELLALVKAYTQAHAHGGQMTLTRQGGITYPDRAKTSWNDAVSWTVDLTFGRGYFTGAVIKFTGRWNAPHQQRQDPYDYNEVQRDLPVEEAVTLFLSDEDPDKIIERLKTR